MKVFVIAITNNDISMNLLDTTLKSLMMRGVKPILFEACTPESMPEDLSDYSTSFSDTEMAVLASHYTLWKKCIELDEEIIIIEHDAILLRDIPFEDPNVKFLGWDYTFDVADQLGKFTLWPALALKLSPSDCSLLIEKLFELFKTEKAYQVDAFYFHTLKPTEKSKVKCFIHNNLQWSMSTIDHPHEGQVSDQPTAVQSFLYDLPINWGPYSLYINN